MLQIVNLKFFLGQAFGQTGLLAIPLIIALSVVCIIFIERIIFYTIIWKQKKAISSIKDVILNNKIYPKNLREDLIDIELDNINSSLTFGLGVLKFIASIATMLGLFGTVIGMIDIFSSIAQVKTAVSPAMISGGIKKAMFTTAYGIGISIFALLVHYVFENISRKIFNKLEEYSILLNATTEYDRISEISKKKL